jgi:hypothetical protein
MAKAATIVARIGPILVRPEAGADMARADMARADMARSDTLQPYCRPRSRARPDTTARSVQVETDPATNFPLVKTTFLLVNGPFRGHPLQTYVAHAVAADRFGYRRRQIDFAARPKPAVWSLVGHRTDHGFAVRNIGHTKPLAHLFKYVRTDEVPIGMQPFAVSRDGVVKLCRDSAVWRRLDARQPEIVECFGAAARACREQRERREHGHNADIHAANCAVYFWARSWRVRAHFSAVSGSPDNFRRIDASLIRARWLAAIVLSGRARADVV